MASPIASLPRDAAPVRTIADLITSDLSVGAHTPIESVVKLFEEHPGLDGLAVLDGERVRFVSRLRFFLQLGRRFGYSLFEKRPVALLAEEGSTVYSDADPVEVIAVATQREPERIYDDILVLESRRYCGLVSMRSLLAHHKELLVSSLAERALLEEKHRKLHEMHRIQSEFIANMTHELRTPLNTVLGAVQILMADADLMERHGRLLEMLDARGRDLLMIVNNMLDLSRLEAGAMTPLIEDVDIAAILEELVAAAEPLVAGKPVRLQISFTNLPATFPTDPVFLGRIVTNLLSNAAKFTQVGSITLAAEADTRALTVRVADTGVGIKESDMERLFSRFSQLASARTKRHEGTGLGLAIVKGLVEQLGGTILVDSREDVGTRFTVRLPRRGAAGTIQGAKS